MGVNECVNRPTSGSEVAGSVCVMGGTGPSCAGGLPETDRTDQRAGLGAIFETTQGHQIGLAKRRLHAPFIIDFVLMGGRGLRYLTRCAFRDSKRYQLLLLFFFLRHAERMDVCGSCPFCGSFSSTIVRTDRNQNRQSCSHGIKTDSLPPELFSSNDMI